MGRSLFGNSVTATQIVLSQLLGNTSSSPGAFDTTTVSANDTSPVGGGWMMSTSYDIDNYARPRNSVAFQHINNTTAFYSLQDELSDYSFIQGFAGTSSTYSAHGRVYDADLNVVMSFPLSDYPDLIAVRLHAGNLYFFRIQSSSTLIVSRLTISTGARTDSSFSLPGLSGYSTSGCSAVFNWTINNKFYVALVSNNTNNMGIYAYNIDTNSIAQEFTPLTSTGMSRIYAMHVNPTGTAISVSCETRGAYNQSVVMFNAGGTNLSQTAPQGNWYANGTYYTFGTYNNSRNRSMVTTDCIVDAQSAIYWDGSTFRQWIGHLAGGDASVQVLYHNVSGKGYNDYMSNARAHPSLTVKNLAVFQSSALGGNGTYSVARNGTSLVFTKLSSAFTAEPVSNKLGGVQLISMGHSSNYLANIVVRNSYTGIQSQYTFTVGIGNRNTYTQVADGSAGWQTSFVTSKGKFYNLAVRGNSTTNANAVTGQIPVFVTATTKTYKATVIGGGGGVSTHGLSSSFAGIASAAGGTRTGYVAGSTIITSGPTRGTGGTGYGADGWGQGEDSAGSNQYGGGSGYVNIAEITLEGGEPYFYVAGLGPQYGKQGAILLEQL